jgi:hypothetical protein
LFQQNSYSHCHYVEEIDGKQCLIVANLPPGEHNVYKEGNCQVAVEEITKENL